MATNRSPPKTVKALAPEHCFASFQTMEQKKTRHFDAVKWTELSIWIHGCGQTENRRGGGREQRAPEVAENLPSVFFRELMSTSVQRGISNISKSSVEIELSAWKVWGQCLFLIAPDLSRHEVQCSQMSLIHSEE